MLATWQKSMCKWKQWTRWGLKGARSIFEILIVVHYCQGEIGLEAVSVIHRMRKVEYVLHALLKIIDLPEWA